MRSTLSLALSVLCLFSSATGFAATKKEKAEATAKLLAAAAEGDEDDILAAIAAGADVNARDADKQTPLMLAAYHAMFGKERQVVEALVKAKARVDDVASDGSTALMAAASAGRDGMLRLLIQNDANVNKKDNDGWTALMYASSAGHWSVVKELLDAEADVTIADKDGWTPMMMALVNGRGSVVERLVKAGATIPAKAPNGLSALLLATRGRDLQSVRLVLATNPELNGVTTDGWTSLAQASGNGDGQIVMDLLRAGVDTSIKDAEGKTALDRAIEYEHTEVAALLGGPWKKRASAGGTNLSIPCPALGGTVTANFAVDGDALVVATTFPHPLTWYLGGGNVNRAESSKKFVYEGSFTPTYSFDTESKFAIDYSQYGTSVMLEYLDSKGEPRQKSVYANVLDVDIEKNGESVDLSELGDETPRPANEEGVLVTRVPLSLLKLTKGKSVKTTGVVGKCTATTKVKL